MVKEVYWPLFLAAEMKLVVSIYDWNGSSWVLGFEVTQDTLEGQ